jgi:hypothetical protein
MLLPFDSVMNLIYTAVPIYEWEPVPPVEAQSPAPACGDATTTADTANADGTPPLQLVFKGMRWIAVPVWTQRENPGWNQVAQDQRDDDARRTQERARQARKEPTPTAPAAAGAVEGGSVE